MPYLPVDPNDIGCSYEAVIRVNSQSGKSGAAWILEQNHGLKLPRRLQQDFSQHVQTQTDRGGHEMTLADIWYLFRSLYIRHQTAGWQLLEYRNESLEDGRNSLRARIQTEEGIIPLTGKGNGLLSAAADALKSQFRVAFAIEDYHEHTLGRHSESRSAAYIRCTFADGKSRWGVCIDNDVARASLQALLNALSL